MKRFNSLDMNITGRRVLTSCNLKQGPADKLYGLKIYIKPVLHNLKLFEVVKGVDFYLKINFRHKFRAILHL